MEKSSCFLILRLQCFGAESEQKIEWNKILLTRLVLVFVEAELNDPVIVAIAVKLVCTEVLRQADLKPQWHGADAVSGKQTRILANHVRRELFPGPHDDIVKVDSRL